MQSLPLTTAAPPLIAAAPPTLTDGSLALGRHHTLMVPSAVMERRASVCSTLGRKQTWLIQLGAWSDFST